MFADMIRAYRRRSGLSQEELAERTGLSVRGIGKLEAGEVAQPRPATVRLLADAFALTGTEREEFQRAATGEPSGPPTEPRGQVRPRQLPAPPRMFTGRVHELATLDRPRDTSTVVIAAVDGMAGVGKTALVLQWAHQAADRFPDGQIFLDLQGSAEGVAPTDPADALERLLQTLGMRGGQIPNRLDDRAGLWRSLLAQRRILLLLDNAAGPAQVRPLLPGTPGCLVLVTSRHRLVGLDPACAVSLDTLPATDAAALFARTTGRDRVDLASGELLAEVVQQCGRLPLAIRIAAARLRSHPTWTLTDLAERLRDHRERLAELDDGARSVTAALNLSYQQLSAAQQRVYRLLGLHPGPDIDPYVAAALGDLTIEQARRRLDQLLNVHLLQEPTPGRLVFHDLVRAHASALAKEETEPFQQAAVSRLHDYFAHTAAAAMDTAYTYRRGRRYHIPRAGTPTPDLSDLSRAIAWLDAELPNLLASAAHAVAGFPEHAKHLSAIVPEHLHTRGRYGDLDTLYHHGLTAAKATADRLAESAALNALGWVHWLRSRYEAGRELFEQALSISHTTGDRDDEANALVGLSWAHLRQGRHEPARDGFQSALQISRITGHRSREQEALNGLGWAHWHQGRYERALDQFSIALEISRSAGHRNGEMDALLALGNAHRMLGRYQPALEAFGRASACADTTGHRYGEMHALLGFGNIHRMLGRYDPALDNFSRALEIARTIGQCEGEMDALNGVGHVQRRQGRYGPAADHYRRALDLARALNNRHWQLEALHGLGRLHHATGEPEAALAHHEQALTLATELRQPADQARIHDGLAHAHQLSGQVGHARRHWEHTLAILNELGIDLTADENTTAASVRSRLSELKRPRRGAEDAAVPAPRVRRQPSHPDTAV